MKKTFNKGFTLIELLVVIAIIGILASVILASLNTARAKGADAATKSDLANARAQAELFYDSTSPVTYAGVCTSTSTSSIKTMVVDAASKSGAAVVCNDSATAWAASAVLKSVGTTAAPAYFCVDSTGASKQEAAQLATGVTVCS
jgi:prepilin-type N-terminal cleavage/methylation domain-containing protein